MTNRHLHYRERVDALKQKYTYAKTQYTTEKEKQEAAETDVKAAGEAQRLIQELAQGVQQTAHRRISSIVSKCLTSIFDEPYDFRIDFERKRGKTEARIVFVRGDLEIDDPEYQIGGGVIEVAAFALRLAAVILSQPPVRRLVVLDEPFRCLSADYRPRVRSMLETLADKLDVQFVMITHIEELQTGKVIELQ